MYGLKKSKYINSYLNIFTHVSRRPCVENIFSIFIKCFDRTHNLSFLLSIFMYLSTHQENTWFVLRIFSTYELQQLRGQPLPPCTQNVRFLYNAYLFIYLFFHSRYYWITFCYYFRFTRHVQADNLTFHLFKIIPICVLPGYVMYIT